MRKQIEWEMQTWFIHRIFFEIVRTTQPQHSNQPKMPMSTDQNRKSIQSAGDDEKYHQNWTERCRCSVSQQLPLNKRWHWVRPLKVWRMNSIVSIHSTRKESNCISHTIRLGRKPSNILNVLAKSFSFHWFLRLWLLCIFHSLVLRANNFRFRSPRIDSSACVCVCLWESVYVVRFAFPVPTTWLFQLNAGRNHYCHIIGLTTTHTRFEYIFKMARKVNGRSHRRLIVSKMHQKCWMHYADTIQSVKNRLYLWAIKVNVRQTHQIIQKSASLCCRSTVRLSHTNHNRQTKHRENGKIIYINTLTSV